MTLKWWQECTRTELGELLPEALVVLAIGAVEQHGPHLPTGTDSLLSQNMVDGAVRAAEPECPRPIVVSPPLWFGASDHHLPFGATASLSVETMTNVLVDLARTVAASGGRRLLIVNGHGGNKGPCESAAAIASIRHDIVVAHLNYWELASDAEFANSPGHAGCFETSLISHLHPELVRELPKRNVPDNEVSSAVTVHDSASWQRIDGYTDDPSAFSEKSGRRWVEAAVKELSRRIVSLGGTL